MNQHGNSKSPQTINETVDAPRPQRRTLLKMGLASASGLSVGGLLAGCGGGSDIGTAGGGTAPVVVPPSTQISSFALAVLPDTMREQQRTFARTGAVHAAALTEVDFESGALGTVFEDVGRHNAVDKAVGAALFDGTLPAQDRLLVVSGRVSFEIVQKAVAAGVAGIVAVSAPTSLAVDLAREYGLVLVGMVPIRGGNA